MSDDLAALDGLAARLWDQRRLVTFLLYRLTVSRLLLADDEQRFVPEVLREVDYAVELLRNCELRRNEAVHALAELWQVAPDEISLPTLAAQAPPPFGHTFTEHLTAFRELAAELETVSRENRSPARAALDHLTDSIEQLTGLEPAGEAEESPRPVSDAEQVRVTSTAAEWLGQLMAPGLTELQIQELGRQATLQALPKALPPSLASFLR